MVNKGGEDLFFLKGIQEIMYVSIFFEGLSSLYHFVAWNERKPNQNNTEHKGC